MPGLHVRVMPTGHRSFVLLGRFPGKPHPTRRALGGYGELTLEEARDKAREWRKLISRGIDPQVQEERERQSLLRQQCITFWAVAEDFIRDKLPSERKGRETQQDIGRELLPKWGAQIQCRRRSFMAAQTVQRFPGSGKPLFLRQCR